MKKINIKYLIDLCTDFTNNNISLEDFREKCDKIIVRNSLTIREKISCIIYILFNCEYSDDLLERFISLEMNKFWYIVLAYCGIDASLEEEYCTEENYDLIRPLIIDGIMYICKNDYEDTMRVFNDVMDYVNFSSSHELLNDLMGQDFSKIQEADKKLIEELKNNEPLIKDLADIMRITNPTLSDMNKKIEKQVISEINNK